jgi:hypothetical protein
MQGPGVHPFQLTDAHGNVHDYVCQEHPAGEGMEIMFELLGMGAPSLLSLLGAAMSNGDGVRALLGALGAQSDEDAPPLDEDELAKLVRGIDLTLVSGELARVLGSKRGPALARAILARTHRDTHPLSGRHLDVAYQANYAELLQACWKVCQINRFFPVPSTSGSGSNETPARTPPLPAA